MRTESAGKKSGSAVVIASGRGALPPRKSEASGGPEAGTTIPIIISHGVGTPGGEWRRLRTVCPCRKRGKITEETPFRLH